MGEGLTGDEAPPADEHAAEREEGFVDVVAYLPANPQAAEPVQVDERALHDPALSAQAGTVLGAAAGYDRLHAEVPNEPAVLVVVVTAVPEYDVRAAARSAALAARVVPLEAMG